MKVISFLFFFVFSPSILLTGESPKKDRVVLEPQKKEVTQKLEIKKDSSDWITAEASYFNPTDPLQTKENCNGIGAFGRKISSGSIAVSGEFLRKYGKGFIEVKNLDIETPYGKGIFRVDDLMHSKNKGVKIDFFFKDLNDKYINLGRFNIKFRVM